MRLVLFTGKGGVGRTTTAAATAVRAAGQGRKTLLVSAGSAPSLDDVLGCPAGDLNGPVEVGAGVAAGLFAVRADPRTAARHLPGRTHDLLLDALDDLGVDPLALDDLADLPGLDDLLTLLVLRDQVRDGPWDLVVLDCPPPSAAFRLLTTPDLLGRLLHRLLPMDRRIARLTARADPGDPLVAGADLLAAELAGVRSMLTAEDASVRLVTTPERVVLAETRRLFTALTMSGFAIDAVLVNRLEGDRNGVVPAEASSSFGDLPVLRLNQAAHEPRGVERLAELARGLGPEPPVPVAAPFGIDRTATGFDLRIALPLARPDELDLGRRGDDLVITVGGYRRLLALPGVLRRCRTDGASLREGVLTVAFVPDPAEFPSRWV
ncbi:hypothetical protein KIH74_19040 [Kineosporia sp. J2-2]|uniref:Arsenite efflux ATP-binding protein ArsA n=1 Tax=Kineosporia corallincola TaxID=2835133 RepID=A0ABS5TLW5_9ACTN|nr:ArsA-related P-loop ATPase [Kineosporia corallincola]MBT0771043.1 hypothetical protein [Kineosporia corallincola]